MVKRFGMLIALMGIVSSGLFAQDRVVLIEESSASN